MCEWFKTTEKMPESLGQYLTVRRGHYQVYRYDPYLVEFYEYGGQSVRVDYWCEIDGPELEGTY